MVQVIAEAGSCHMGRMGYAKELINVAADCGCDACKFQLFPNRRKYTKCGNIPLPYEWFPELVEYGKGKGIEVFASVFDVRAGNCVLDAGVKSVKISYSQNYSKLANLVMELANYRNVYMSGDFNSRWSIYKDEPIKLYCIPEYPVKYLIDWEGVFPCFDGFSDHTIGVGQTLTAVAQGARYIEKHITLDRADISCPDHNFAIRPGLLKKMVRSVKDYVKCEY